MNLEQLDLKGKRVLMRVDFNVPMNAAHEITDDTRIVKALPSIKYILSQGSRLILMSHLGQPLKKLRDDGSIDVQKFTLSHLLPYLREILDVPVGFSADCVGDEALTKSKRLHDGEVLLLENTRFHSEEKEGDPEFAARLAAIGEVYVNDAFGTAHRSHASTVVVANYFKPVEKAYGYLMTEEIKNAKYFLGSPARPFTAIIGGAKVSDKIKLLDRLIEKADNILIGGGMAYTFIKVQGGDIGKSLCENDFLGLAEDILNKARENNTDIFLPEDSVIADGFSADSAFRVSDSASIPESWMGLDIGPNASLLYRRKIIESGSILWNGPMGVFEFENFSKGTFSVAQALADATDKGAYSLIGGGDSVSAINKAGVADRMSFVSTGGGAMLEFLEGKSLPGIEAIG